MIWDLIQSCYLHNCIFVSVVIIRLTPSPRKYFRYFKEASVCQCGIHKWKPVGVATSTNSTRIFETYWTIEWLINTSSKQEYRSRHRDQQVMQSNYLPDQQRNCTLPSLWSPPTLCHDFHNLLLLLGRATVGLPQYTPFHQGSRWSLPQLLDNLENIGKDDSEKSPCRTNDHPVSLAWKSSKRLQ